MSGNDKSNVAALIADQEYDSLPVEDRRTRILQFEKALSEMPGALGEDPYPLGHSFAPGMYAREIFIPKHQFIVGKIHKHDHFLVFLSGDAIIVSPEGRERINTPCVKISKAGTKRVVFTFEHTRIVTFHSTESTDLKQIEAEHIAKTFDEVEL